MTEESIVISNDGPATAHRVVVELHKECGTLVDVADACPFDDLMAGDELHLNLVRSFGDRQPVTGRLSWVDERGSHDRPLRLMPQRLT